MNKLHCAHESEVSRAVRSGFWPAALADHAETCPVCSETRIVAAALVEESARIHAVSRPPDAAATWLEARRRARMHLRRRALFWFRALRTLALVYIPALLIGSVTRASHHAPATAPWKPSLDFDFSSLLTGPAEKFAITGALLAVLCISMGSWYLLREARTSLAHSPGR
jgi:hypothetical protein